MKKYRLLLDVVLLASLSLMAVLAIAPDTFVMPNSLQMVLLAATLGLIASFLVVLYRESPNDEREAQNQAVASRSAYIVGAGVLIIAMIIQSLQHKLDPVIPITLLVMIATKIIVQTRRDN